LDLRQAQGQSLAKRLISTADVLVENFKPGTLEKWNLDPEQLRAENPRLVVSRVSGFGPAPMTRSILLHYWSTAIQQPATFLNKPQFYDFHNFNKFMLFNHSKYCRM
jgi:hypothetical protein